MSTAGHTHIPLDPGRVNVLDPEELAWWCAHLHCDERTLKEAVSRVGPHATKVRDAIAQKGVSSK